MRIDHIAFRTKDRKGAEDFFIKALGYKIAKKYPNGFHIDFEDGTFVDCTVLEPGTKSDIAGLPWIMNLPIYNSNQETEYHLPPEIFISQGSAGSIVDDWVNENGNGLHHIALLVDSVEETKKQWESLGYIEFSGDPTVCPGLTQIFTKPSSITGFIYELIEREKGEDGFCNKNVKNLMQSTKINKKF